jgi:hypothetical protein
MPVHDWARVSDGTFHDFTPPVCRIWISEQEEARVLRHRANTLAPQFQGQSDG